MKSEGGVSRRDFLKVSGGASMGLLLSFSIPATRQAWAGVAPGESAQLSAWVKIAPDGVVTFYVDRMEMGQGVMTALPMLIAEELEVDWSQVRAEHAPVDAEVYGRPTTGGSRSVRSSFDPMRRAGAVAREMLVATAAERWGVEPSSCRAEKGHVLHEASGRQLGYGELAAAAAQRSTPEAPPLKDRTQYRVLGVTHGRLDTPAKVDGSAVYGMDVQVQGLLVAQVERSPVLGGRVKSFDATAALATEGVKHVVQIPSGVAVVATGFWAAKKGRDALRVHWDEGEHANLSSEGIRQACIEAVPHGTVVREEGDVARGIEAAAKTVTAVYEFPFLAHATMEPMNCTAHVRSDRCDLWAPTQAPGGAQQKAAEITGLPESAVQVHTTFLGGGFGRRSATDFVEDAVHTSKAVGAPVKVIFTREDDTRAAHYRPTGYHELAGGVDAEGWPVAWRQYIAAPSIMQQKGWPTPGGVDPTTVEGVRNLPYAIPNLEVRVANVAVPVPLHWWRSVGSSQNAYITECFLDELCAAGGVDPLAARLRLLADHPRHRRVLEMAAEKAGWGGALAAGHAHGVAMHESFGSFVAQVAEVSVRDNGVPRVHRVTCVVDCGEVVNPGIVEAQMEGAITFGLSAALQEAVTVEKGRFVQGNFDTYPLLRMPQMPRVDTHIIAGGDEMGGIGEPGTPPVAPAVCNAIAKATGKPVRRLPIRRLAV